MAAPTQERPARHEYEFTVIIEQDEDGVYIAHCPALPGCHSAGDTEGEAREMIADAIALYIDLLHERGEEIPPDVNVTTIRVLA
ncbi:MAG: hypothetical protein AVDCRST_MAG18-1189 [uncultured Thermomicrobiales bacterium]|uniref:HicB-like antitoxin of toxin-antitoxin system domain-containing protein n=1 Tax=uncultured Thermomicrobiales bacterium TaxID=1645740 RepID=A0A6J4UX13_9BACT|nr:MAG: hypothetical protein AVDCRST_MAG18-1189 [uncultured Thermomicrobiales bacterium]